MWTADQPASLDTPIGRAVRAIELILLQGGQPWTLEDLAEAMALPLPAVRRLVRSLVEHGLLIGAADQSSYLFGPRLLRLANLIQSNLPLEQIARPVMRSLVAEFDETVTLNAYLRHEGMSICVAVEECDKPMQYVLEPGELKHLHSGAAGKAIMAFLSEEAVDRIIKRHRLPAVTPKTVTSRAALARDLAHIRRSGVAVTRGERVKGAVGAAAPVFGGNGQVLASLTITIPEMRCSPAILNAAKRAVRRRAKQLSLLLGMSADGKAASRARRPATRARRRA